MYSRKQDTVCQWRLERGLSLFPPSYGCALRRGERTREREQARPQHRARGRYVRRRRLCNELPSAHNRTNQINHKNHSSDKKRMTTRILHSLPKMREIPAPYGNFFPPPWEIPAPYGNSFPPLREIPASYGISFPPPRETPTPYGNSFPPLRETPTPDGIFFPPPREMPTPYGNSFPPLRETPATQCIFRYSDSDTHLSLTVRIHRRANAFKQHMRAQPPLGAAVGLYAASPPPPCGRRPGFPLQSLARNVIQLRIK
jgi:hypothetical protein